MMRELRMSTSRLGGSFGSVCSGRFDALPLALRLLPLAVRILFVSLARADLTCCTHRKSLSIMMGAFWVC